MCSAEQKGPRKLSRVRPEIFDFAPDLGLQVGQTNAKFSGTAPANRHATILNDSRPISPRFDDDPTLINCEIAQPTTGASCVEPSLGCTRRPGFRSWSNISGLPETPEKLPNGVGLRTDQRAIRRHVCVH